VKNISDGWLKKKEDSEGDILMPLGHAVVAMRISRVVYFVYDNAFSADTLLH
jgi:hypothetical protein